MVVNEEKTCFIITPIGGDSTEIRRAAEGVMDAVIIPALKDSGFKEENIKVAHRMSNPGSINKQVISRIVEDDLAIVNLTGLNPNVMYELAVRHAVRKPVIQICESNTRLPFDIVDERTIFYTNDMRGVIELRSNLDSYLSEIFKEDKPDNPIYRVVDEINLLRNNENSNNDVNKYIIDRLSSIENSIGTLRNHNVNQNSNTVIEDKPLNVTIVVKVKNVVMSGDIVDYLWTELDKYYDIATMGPTDTPLVAGQMFKIRVTIKRNGIMSVRDWGKMEQRIQSINVNDFEVLEIV